MLFLWRWALCGTWTEATSCRCIIFLPAGARRLTRRLQQPDDEISAEKSNRLLAGQVLAELTQLQKPESFRLQVGVYCSLTNLLMPSYMLSLCRRVRPYISHDGHNLDVISCITCAAVDTLPVYWPFQH